jgi:Ca2+-binding RTX toxin-like protein
MKRAILTAITVLAALAAAPAHAGEAPLTVLLAGGPEADTIEIGLSPDGRSYLIDSAVPLEVGGTICLHPEAQPNELVCEAIRIGGFEVNAGGGDDTVIVAAEVPTAVTLRGGPGNDRLVGGANSDKLIGGSGDDTLVGRALHDALFGGPGNDRLFGGSGSDVLNGGPGEDELFGGSGNNHLVP